MRRYIILLAFFVLFVPLCAQASSLKEEVRTLKSVPIVYGVNKITASGRDVVILRGRFDTPGTA